MVAPLAAEKKAIVEGILERASSDIEFREKLLLNPQEALKDSGLTPEEKEILVSLKKVKLEEWGVDTRRYLMMARDNGNGSAAS
jgi:hypothetical protein